MTFQDSTAKFSQYEIDCPLNSREQDYLSIEVCYNQSTHCPENGLKMWGLNLIKSFETHF